MTYDEVLSQVLELLQRDKRVAYRVLKRRFGLDDEYVDDLKADLIKAKRLAKDEEGEVLVWTGAAVEQESGNRRTGESEKERHGRHLRQSSFFYAALRGASYPTRTTGG